jgi:integrase/recombinase XerD
MLAADSSARSPLRAALERYLRHLSIERGRSANTVAAYRRDLRSYLDALDERGVTTPDAVVEEHITAFVRARRERPDAGLSASSTARLLSSIRGFHRFLVEEGLAVVDVTAELRPPKPPRRLPKAITVDQMAALLATTEGDDDVSVRDRALLELLYATGARVSEAVGLNVDDVIDGAASGAADVVRLFGKGGKQRIVPVGSFARAALEAYLVRVRPVLSARGRATPALFLGVRGRRLSRQSAWLVIQARAEQSKLGIEVSPHTFRHSFATHLLEGGADVRVVQELLGHASVATTQIYTLVTADALRDMYTTAHPRAG